MCIPTYVYIEVNWDNLTLFVFNLIITGITGICFLILCHFIGAAGIVTDFKVFMT